MSEQPDPIKALKAIAKMAPLYAQAKGQRVYLEAFGKTLKATIMREHEGIPITAQEREAYADQRYVTHLEGLRAATEQEETLRWRLVAAQAAIDVWRSTEASNRAIDRGAA